MNFASLEATIKNYETEKAQKIASVKEKATREKIVPFNAEIDNYRAKAINELNNELATKINEINAEASAKVTELRKEYEQKKNELVTLGEEKKRTSADTVIATETAAVSVEYDGFISELNAILAKMKQ